MILIAFLFITTLLIVRLTIIHADQGRMLEECAQCHYTLAGLDEVSLCPECGSTLRTPEWTVTRLAFRPNVNLPLLYASCLTLIAFVRLADPFARELLIFKYTLDGLSKSAATIAVENRAFQVSALTFTTLAPLTLFVILSPLIALQKHRLTATRLWVTLFLTSLLLTIIHGTQCLHHLW